MRAREEVCTCVLDCVCVCVCVCMGIDGGVMLQLTEETELSTRGHSQQEVRLFCSVFLFVLSSVHTALYN